MAQDDDESCMGHRHAAALGEEVAKDTLRKLAKAGYASALVAVRDLGLGPL